MEGLNKSKPVPIGYEGLITELGNLKSNIAKGIYSDEIKENIQPRNTDKGLKKSEKQRVLDRIAFLQAEIDKEDEIRDFPNKIEE